MTRWPVQHDAVGRGSTRSRAKDEVDIPQKPLHVQVEVDLFEVDGSGLPVNDVANHPREACSRPASESDSNQDRDDMDILLPERGLDLNSDPVKFLLYPQITSAVLAHPVRPDDRQHDLALLEHAAYVLAEIDAERRPVRSP